MDINEPQWQEQSPYPDRSETVMYPSRFDFTILRFDEDNDLVETIQFSEITNESVTNSDPHCLERARKYNHRFVMTAPQMKNKVIEWSLDWLQDRVFIHRIHHLMKPDGTLDSQHMTYVAPIFPNGSIGAEFHADYLGMGLVIPHYPIDAQEQNLGGFSLISWSLWKRGKAKWIAVELVGFDFMSLTYLAKEKPNGDWYRLTSQWLDHYNDSIRKGMTIAQFIKYTEEGLPEGERNN